MVSTSSRGWRELRRNSNTQCPKLFYTCITTDSDLELFLTDLVVIWRCELSQADIIFTARRQRSAIDPNESKSQLKVLLQKLELALSTNNNELKHDESLRSQIVYLNTRVDLPKPLNPLRWTFKLLPQDSSELAEQLLRPALLEASNANKKIDLLRSIIKDKDHVIDKLLEKLESSGTDFSLIFPGIKSRKARVSEADARRHVAGMATFDEHSWSANLDHDSAYAAYEAKGIGNLVHGCEQCPRHTTKQHNDWLKGLPEMKGEFEKEPHEITNDSDIDRDRLETLRQGTRTGDGHFGHLTDEDSDFERAHTPPAKQIQKRSRVESVSSQASSKDDRSDKGSKRPKLDGARTSITRNADIKRHARTSADPSGNQSPPSERRMSNASTATASTVESEIDRKTKRTQKPGVTRGDGFRVVLRASSPDGAIDDESSAIGRHVRSRDSPDKYSLSDHASSASVSDEESDISVKRKTRTSTAPPRRLGRLGRGNSPAAETNNNDTSLPPPEVPIATSSSSTSRNLGRLGQRNVARQKNAVSALKSDLLANTGNTTDGYKAHKDQDTKIGNEADEEDEATASPTPSPSPSPPLSDKLNVHLHVSGGQDQGPRDSKKPDDGNGKRKNKSPLTSSPSRAPSPLLLSSAAAPAASGPVLSSKMEFSAEGSHISNPRAEPKVETAEAKIQRRKQELQQQTAGGGGGGGSGVQKRRKF